MKILSRVMYAGLGGFCVLAGAAGLLVPERFLPIEARNLFTVHFVREEGSQYVFVGLMLLWCFSHFDQRRWVHFALLFVSVLFAGIHWFDHLENGRSLAGPLLTSVPFLLLAGTAPYSDVGLRTG